MKTRILNIVTFGILTAAVFVLMLTVTNAGLSLSIYAATGVLLMKPNSREGLAFSLTFAAGMPLLCVCGTGILHLEHPYAVIQIASFLYVCVREVLKYYVFVEKTLATYKHWNYLEDGCRIFCLAMFLPVGFADGWLLPALLMAIMILRCFSGYAIVVLPPQEKKVRSAGEILVARKSASPVLEPGRESDIFEKIETYMKTKKPYLEEDFCLEDICAELLTNKLYVSKTINDCFEDNFRAYLNGYRIDHAKSVICSNPKVKMSDVASMSGYRCLATFNSSFKDITGMTPGDYSRQEMVRQHLSTNRERVL